jgi:secernin
MCDTVAAVGTHGTLFAKNSDRPPGEPQVFEAWPTRPPGGPAGLRTQYLTLGDRGAFAVAGSRPSWLWGLEHGVNDRRVAAGNEMLWTAADPRAAPDALIGMDLVRLLLERAPTAEAGVEVIGDLLARHGQGGAAELDPPKAYSSSFLVADPASAWVVETSGATWAAREVTAGAGVAISNRISLRDDWTRGSPDLAPGTDFDRFRKADSPTGHADRRLEVTAPAVAGGADGLAARDLAALLRDHGGRPWGRPGDAGDDPVPPPPADRPSPAGVSVCMHLRGVQVTNAAMVAELPRDPDAPVRAWVALGPPCASIFVPVFPPDGVPAALGDVASWAAFDASRPPVEGPDGAAALASRRAAWAALEAELWDEADACATPGREAARARFVQTVWPRVVAASRGTE